jgi:hypothetical protein
MIAKFRYFEKDGAVFRQHPKANFTVQEVSHGGKWVDYTGDQAAPVVFGNEITAAQAGERDNVSDVSLNGRR